MSELLLNVTKREHQGKGASRRLRHAGQTAAIVYGGEAAPLSITMVQKDINKALLNDEFYSSVLTLDIEGTKQDVILVDLQRHPAKDLIMHADFLRVEPTTVISKKVPLNFTNETACVGVKIGGGKITHVVSEVLITCQAKDLPASLTVDMLKVTAGTVLHISDIVMPEGVQSKDLLLGADHNGAIASISVARGGALDDEDEAPAAEAAPAE